MSKRGKTALYCESASDYRITDESGQTITIDEAKKRWNKGVTDYNLAFSRLANNFNFDIGALREFYTGKRP